MKFLRLDQVIKLIALKRSAVYARVADGRMPSPFHLGSAAVWSDEELQGWLKRVCEHGEPPPGSYSRRGEAS